MLDVALVIVALAVAVLIGALVPAIIELRSTLIKLQQTLTLVNAEAVPMLRDVRQVTERASEMVSTAERGVQTVSRVVGRLSDPRQLFFSSQDSLRFQGRSALATLLSVGAGLRAASYVMKTWRHHQREGDGNGQ